MDEFIQFITQLGTTVGLNLLWGLLILIVGLKLANWIVKFVASRKSILKIDPGVQSFIRSFLKVVLYAAVIASACITWGIPSASFMTIFASAGVAIGLALQGTLSNFAGGLMILFFKPFKVGDYIESGAVAGVVQDITIIYTIIVTVDNKTITVPNGSLTNSSITNYSAKTTRRVDLTISAGYDDDIDKVKNVLLQVANAHEKVLRDPAPFVRLKDHSSSSLDYTFRVWCQSADYWEVYFDMEENIKKAFDRENITIPYKHVDITMLSK